MVHARPQCTKLEKQVAEAEATVAELKEEAMNRSIGPQVPLLFAFALSAGSLTLQPSRFSLSLYTYHTCARAKKCRACETIPNTIRHTGRLVGRARRAAPRDDGAAQRGQQEGPEQGQAGTLRPLPQMPDRSPFQLA